MKKLVISITLICILILSATLACVSGDVDGKFSQTSAYQAESHYGNSLIKQSADVTATFGAEQFHLQLTAIAEVAANE
jgi:hypothetical protein